MQSKLAMNQPSATSVSVVSDVDVLVIGTSSAAIAAALEVHDAGRSVMVAGDLTYFGSDFAGTFQLWPGDWVASDPLLEAAFAESRTLPARPLAIKRAMEEALLKRGISFLFQCRPVAVLRGVSEGVSGVVLATRTSLLGVTCGAVIDASEQGLCARLEGVPLMDRTDVSSTVEWTVLGTEAPRDWPGTIEEILPEFQQRRDDGELTYRAFRLGIDRAQLGPDPRAAAHVARSLFVDEQVLIAADLPVEMPAETLAGGFNSKDRLVDLNRDDVEVARGIWLLNGLLPLSRAGIEEFGRPDQRVALGRRIGRMVAELRSCRAEISGDLGSAASAHTRDFRFAPVFLRDSHRVVAVADWAMREIGAFDVVVCGGGTGGAPAGIAAARSGGSSVVLEMQRGLGGIGTLGLISAYWFGNRVGFTAELNEAVSQHDSWSRSKDGASWRPEVKSRVYHRMLQAAGGQAWMGSFAFGVQMDGDRVAGLLVSTPFGSGLVACSSVVDATGNADVAAAAGAPCRVIEANHLAVQGSGMSSRSHPGVGYQNSDHTFIDDTDPIGVTSAFVHARAKYSPDFDTISMVNSRERRQILAEVEVSPLDILAHRTYPDTVVVAFSNFDTHGFTIHPVFMLAPPDHDPIRANIPYRCMLPKGVEGVIVTGLGMSAHRDALPLLRMQADVQNQGYVAGLAAAGSASTGVPLRDLDLRGLQQELVKIGILDAQVLNEVDSFPMSVDAVRKAVDGDLAGFANIAILLAHPEASREPLLEVMAHDVDSRRRSDAARLLGMMGESAAVPLLRTIIQSSNWDEGWNYRGMGQFGSSMSWLDSAIIALGRTRAPEGSAAIESKIRELGADAEFSHCRAVALAVAMRPNPQLASALEQLLEKPGFRGHALTDLGTIRAEATDDPVETQTRNFSLREIYLAMGLLLAGDPRGQARKILESYQNDLRGHFARYARALLADSDHSSLIGRIA